MCLHPLCEEKKDFTIWVFYKKKNSRAYVTQPTKSKSWAKCLLYIEREKDLERSHTSRLLVLGLLSEPRNLPVSHAWNGFISLLNHWWTRVKNLFQSGFQNVKHSCRFECVMHVLNHVFHFFIQPTLQRCHTAPWTLATGMSEVHEWYVIQNLRIHPICHAWTWTQIWASSSTEALVTRLQNNAANKLQLKFESRNCKHSRKGPLITSRKNMISQ